MCGSRRRETPPVLPGLFPDEGGEWEPPSGAPGWSVWVLGRGQTVGRDGEGTGEGVGREDQTRRGPCEDVTPGDTVRDSLGLTTPGTPSSSGGAWGLRTQQRTVGTEEGRGGDGTGSRRSGTSTRGRTSSGDGEATERGTSRAPTDRERGSTPPKEERRPGPTGSVQKRGTDQGTPCATGVRRVD